MRTGRRPSAQRSTFFGVFLTLLFAALSICLAPCQAIAAETSADMYRLYNQWTGEHFYTASVEERDGLVAVGWTDEGLGWVAPTSGDPVHRLYNPYVAGGDHHYTLSAAERDGLVEAGWEYEGVGWRSAPADTGVPLYRQYNPYATTGTHNYTVSKAENDHLVSVGWREEGVGWYGRGNAPAAGEEVEDSFTLLGPGFTSERVTNEHEAREVIEDISEELGIDDVGEELVNCEESEALGNHYWRFSQSYEGIPVYGRDVIVGADGDGVPLFLSSNFLDVGDVPTTPALSGEEAEEAVGPDAVYGGTVVYSLGEVESCLAWQVVVPMDDGVSISFVDSSTGEVVGSEPLMIEETVTATSMDMDTGEAISFQAWRDEDGEYRLWDNERNIEAYDAHGGPLSIEGVFSSPDGTTYYLEWSGSVTWHTEDGTQIPASNVPSDREFVGLWLSSDAALGKVSAVTSATQDFADSRSASTYERLQLVSDFYAQELGRIGYDGEGGSTVLVVNDNRLGATNAYASSFSRPDKASVGVEDMNAAVISIGENNSRSVDIVAHEYTHSVEKSISGMVSSGESGALKEATSDIMGEVAQDYRDNGLLDGSMDWVHNGRNLGTPALSTAFERGDNEPSAHPSAYHDANWGDVNDPLDSGYVHNNSTVISHAAFLMCEGSGLPGESLTTEELARLVYATFHSLTPDCTFAQYRQLFELNASNMAGQGLLSEGKLPRISAAFDRVNVRDSEGGSAQDPGESGLSYVSRDVIQSRTVTAYQGSYPFEVSRDWAYPQFATSDGGSSYNLDRLNNALREDYEARLDGQMSMTPEAAISGAEQILHCYDTTASIEGPVACVRLDRDLFYGGAHGTRVVGGKFYDLASGEEMSTYDALGMTEAEIRDVAREGLQAYFSEHSNVYGVDYDDAIDYLFLDDMIAVYRTEDAVVACFVEGVLGPVANGGQEIVIKALTNQVSVGDVIGVY